MAGPAYLTTPSDTSSMPPGIPNIIGNEVAERFSFYGMKAILAVFMADYLHLLGDTPEPAMSEAAANERYHYFNMAVYLTPFLGAILADAFFGKYKIIIWLSLVYCLGHFTLAFMGVVGSAGWWLFGGLALISLGSGGIKPCVSAHVGDQFGPNNHSLLPKIFAAFYFSINLGALGSQMLIPSLLEWHGPHLAFGIPGVLMALATVVFWMGRHRFVHIPPGGASFVRQTFSREGLGALGQLTVLFLFVAVFWALFDQTGSSWIFQAQDMDRRLFGVEWLPSQVQSINSFFILLFIPAFTYGVYPAAERVWRFTPLRKIGSGLALMVVAFALSSLIQVWIENGQRPSIAWQILAYALLTASEVLVSITALEFAYTQAPRKMKSLVMSLYLFSVAAGNFLTAGVNHAIQVPAVPLSADNVHPGFDGQAGTSDDLRLGADGQVMSGAAAVLLEAVTRIESAAAASPTHQTLPTTPQGTEALANLKDPWNRPLRYALLNSETARVSSDGPDGQPNSQWDLGVILTRRTESRVTATKPTWLDRRKTELGLGPAPRQPGDNGLFDRAWYAGGQTKLEGSAYFWFFTWLMAATAILFVIASRFYRGRDTVAEQVAEPPAGLPEEPC
ncbi:MAG: proton-dependent oligopeptide transporter, POT family [Verrucomicrobia bacterium]|nr:MAG: proton-dependent oligopeptide transporter, POT family [Verrucomicrobiota bacterium]